LSVLASWATVDLPVNKGHIPAGEYFDKKLEKDLSETKDTLDRQIIILNWFFEHFDKFLEKENILKYEDTINENGNNFGKIAYDETKKEFTKNLSTRNSNPVYKKINIDIIYNRLIESKGTFWKYYSINDINDVLKELKDM